MSRHRALLLALSFGLLTTSCGGGGGGDAVVGNAGCSGACAAAGTSADRLSATDVERILAQAITEASARIKPATLVVVDRTGRVLAAYRMVGATATVTVRAGRAGLVGGLEGLALPSELAAISKALTGAYLSSEGNAFSTRTASQIVQENFSPGEVGSPAGPLFGVQFSQLSCSDVMTRESDGSVGPHRSPLGFSADPGGLPLYKAGVLVGGIGAVADATYGLDRNIDDVDHDDDEAIAAAGAISFEAALDRRADRILVDGRSLRYVDNVDAKAAGAVPAFSSLPASVGGLIAVSGYAPASVREGARFGDATSGIRADTVDFLALGGHVLVDASNGNRFAPRAGTDGGLTVREVRELLRNALTVAGQARAQIRRPLGTAAQVNISVVDTKGELLGLVRTADAPVFGADVAVQKARSAVLFSSTTAGNAIGALPALTYPTTPPQTVALSSYVSAMRTLLNLPNSLADGTAYTSRALGNLARPFFPDGINGRAATPGPLSTSFATAWSPFNIGLQQDLIAGALVAAVFDPATPAGNCTGLQQARNGIQLFPGGIPIYRGSVLVGAIGVSGDGVDQDDMVAALGLQRGAAALATGLNHAPAAIRADRIAPLGEGSRLRYVQCPQAPFINSEESNVCGAL